MKPILIIPCAVGVAAMWACSGAHESHHSQAIPIAATAPAPDTSGLDVPALLTLSVDGLTRRLGPLQPVPVSFVDPTLAPLVQHEMVLDSTAILSSHGLTMVVTYNYPSRKVSDLLLLGANEDELMRRGRLQLGAGHYLVIPVFQERLPTQLLGLRVLALASNE